MDSENIKSVEIWKNFLEYKNIDENKGIPASIYFCDNKIDANECAELVLKNIKRATATSLMWFNRHNKPIPNVGDQYIVTDWKGNAKAIIENDMVEQVPFNKINTEFAITEGEGDKSLKHWKKVHKAYYTRELQNFCEKFDENMILVCEKFNMIWPI